MRQESWWDPQAKLIRSQDPAKMTPQQKANWVLIQYVLDAEYRRGFEEGQRSAAGNAWEDQTDGVLNMHTRPVEQRDIDEATGKGKMRLDRRPPVL